MEPLPRLLIAAGLTLLVLGLALYLFPSLPVLGKLPGDLRIERPGFTLYIPIVSCIVVSGLLSALLWLLSRMR